MRRKGGWRPCGKFVNQREPEGNGTKMPKAQEGGGGESRLGSKAEGEQCGSQVVVREAWEPESEGWSHHVIHKMGQGLNPKVRSPTRGRRTEDWGKESLMANEM